MSIIATRMIGCGFPEPVHDAQASFRAILAAMAEPGTLQTLFTHIDCPAPLHRAAAICLLTLADQETKLWLSNCFGSVVAGYLRFHCGAPITAVAMEANFAVLAAEEALAIGDFNVGDDRYPDRSGTIIVQCESLMGGMPVSLAGPGIRGLRAIAPMGLSASFWRQVAANHAAYPLGVDFLLVSGSDVMAIPRSTTITVTGEQG